MTGHPAASSVDGAFTGGRGGASIVQVDGCLLMSVQGDIASDGFRASGERMLAAVRQQPRRAVIVDLSAVEVIDDVEFAALLELAATSRMLGARCVFSGLAPGIVAFLVSADLPTESVEAFRSVDDALAALRASDARAAGGVPA